MKAINKVKWLILKTAYTWDKKELAYPLSDEEVEALYEKLVEEDGHWDARSEVRGGQVETGLPCEWSRHYESNAVASQLPDGSWIGWTYWYGGGKHSEPEAIDWMEDAYDLNCKEEEKLVIVRTFTTV